MEPSSSFSERLNVSINGELASEENPAKEIEAIFPTLPPECSWKVSENFYKYQEFWIYSNFLEGIMFIQQNFIAQPTHIFLCTCPKSGTKWLKAPTFPILRRTQCTNSDSHASTNPILNKMPHDIVPILEFFHSMDHVRDSENPLISTHLPFSSLPQSIVNSESKIIYFFRDPKDVFVSQWHYVAKHHNAKLIEFQEAFEKFCSGVSGYGPYCNHVLGFNKFGC